MWLGRLTSSATVMGSIPAFLRQVESEGRLLKQCLIYSTGTVQCTVHTNRPKLAAACKYMKKKILFFMDKKKLETVLLCAAERHRFGDDPGLVFPILK